jgi:hypothetical protein
MIGRTNMYRFMRSLAVGGLMTALLAPWASVQAAERNTDARRDSARSANEVGFQARQKKKQLEASKKKAATNPNKQQ